MAHETPTPDNPNTPQEIPEVPTKEVLDAAQHVVQFTADGPPIDQTPGAPKRSEITEGDLEPSTDRSGDIAGLADTVFKKMHGTAPDPKKGVEFMVGKTLTPEAASSFSSAISLRVHELSMIQSLTSYEISFINKTNTMLAGVMIDKLDKITLPEETALDLETHAKRFMALADRTALSDLDDSNDHGPVILALIPIAAESVNGMRIQPWVRGAYEDLAIALTKGFAELVKANGGLKIDKYTASNLNRIVEQYKNITPEVSN